MPKPRASVPRSAAAKPRLQKRRLNNRRKFKMKTKNLFLLSGLIAGLNLMPVGRVTAQTFTTLHTFSGFPDGGSPLAGNGEQPDREAPRCCERAGERKHRGGLWQSR